MLRISLLVVFALVGPLPAQTPRAEKAAEIIDRYLAGCARFGYAGAALVARDGKVILEKGYGPADRERGVPNGPDTLFEIASSTKPFTAAAILKLEQAKKLSTGDPISKYLESTPREFRDITIFHLLTHTSGMPRGGPSGRGPDLDRAVAEYFSGKRERKPDVKHEYWNGGYALLAGIVEVVSGMSYMDFCRKYVLKPAGMKRSGFTGDRQLAKKKAAVGYDGEERIRTAIEHPYGSYGWQYRGMGGLVTSVRELWRWDRALHKSKVLKKKTRAKYFKPYLDGYACGWSVRKVPGLGDRIAHGGDVRGFHTQMIRYPDEGAFIALTCNVEDVPMWSVAAAVEERLFGDRRRYPRPADTAELDEKVLGAIAGAYRLPDGGRLRVRAADGGLHVHVDGDGAARLLDDRGDGAAASRSGPRPPDDLVFQPVRQDRFVRFGWFDPPPPELLVKSSKAGVTALVIRPRGGKPVHAVRDD